MHPKDIKFATTSSLRNYIASGTTRPVVELAKDELARRLAFEAEMHRIDNLGKRTPS
ncbi:hypothetical protein LCGC14_1902350 [marine sediment metagenome]|uniref:Uncharacterized protein n=1 Tax=marine sediment metagenome TaxID=412755 RepID=A0A0F9FWG5_9ZZZZ